MALGPMAISLRATSILAVLALSSRAFAQPAVPPPTPAPVPTTIPVAPDKEGKTPDIAKPGDGANPEDVAKAKAVANKAALTPIIINSSNPTQPAFQLYAEIDLPIVAVGAVFALGRLAHHQSAFCAPTCDKATLNGLDKLVAGKYSTGWSTASDIGLASLALGTAAVLISDEGILDAINDGVVVGEATLSATAVASIMTLAAGRPRPFLFGDPSMPESYKAPLSVRNSSDAGLSFLSSHTSEAFAIVTALVVAERRLHPGSPRAKIIAGIGYTIASFVALSRVMAGYHFVTDVVGGAVVGTSLGVLIGSVHNSPVHVVPVVGDQNAGIGVSGSF